jgi:hypothetical protein
MNKKQFDSQFITEVQGRKVVIFDQNYYHENDIFVPIQYFSTVKIEFLSKPKVDKIRASQQGTRHVDTFGREIMQNAEIRQETVRNYAAVRLDNSPFFSKETHDAVDRKNHSTRMAFPSVEAGMTREMMQAIIDSYDNPKIFEILSDIPILNLRQLTAIEAGLTDIETIMDGVPRVIDADGNNARHEDGSMYELDEADFDAGHRIERRGGQRLRYPVGAVNPDTGEDISGQPIFRQTGTGIKEQFRANYLDLEGVHKDYDFRERVISPITTTNLGRQSFAQLSNHARFTQTADTQMHNEDPDSTGGNPSTSQLRREGKISNAFDGIRTSTSVTSGITSMPSQGKFSVNPTGEPVQPGVAVGGDNPESDDTLDQQAGVPRHTTRNAPTQGSNNPAKGGENPNEKPDRK